MELRKSEIKVSTIFSVSQFAAGFWRFALTVTRTSTLTLLCLFLPQQHS